METEYVHSPDLRVRRLRAGDAPIVWAGSGHDRYGVEIDAPSPADLIAWLLKASRPTTESGLLASLRVDLGLEADAAKQVLKKLIEAGTLVEKDPGALSRVRAERWQEFGWSDPAAFHSATFGQRFDPDTLDGMDYPSYYRQLLEDSRDVGEQPPAVKPVDHYGDPAEVEPADRVPVAAMTVLNGLMPINRFERSVLDAADVVGLLSDAAGAQRTVGGILGEHLIKAHPSGGARHPLECYVVAKHLNGMPGGVYHFKSTDHRLRPVPDAGAPEEIDTICFGKGGIATAAAVVVVTCRWLRHSWKYRYPRSYRMIMLELGHLVQTFNFTATARGLGAYHCPSIDDAAMLEFLGLDDDGIEGPLYAIGIGAEGIR